ncbi:MAG: MFS transporter [Defluviitaleaceae bacterium]|nr:MFS transporter [Defluviitaleaceae bacterium]
MEDRGISVYNALTIFTVSQVLHVLATFTLKMLADYGINPIKIIRVSLVIRLLAIGLMLSITNVTIFITLFFIYRLCTTANILFEGLLVQKTQKENISFGRVRMFGSIGFASGGIVTFGIVLLFGQISYLLILMAILDGISAFISFKYPIKLGEKQKERNEQTDNLKINKNRKQKNSINPLKGSFSFIFLCAAAVAFADSFNIILNHQYIYSFRLTQENAIFWGGIAIIFSAFVSEVPAMLYAEQFIKKIGAKKIMMIGFSLSIVRWLLAAIAPNHILFTSTYLFHGIIFSFIFLGMIEHFKESGMGQKVVLTFTLIVSTLLLILTQTFSFILEHFDAIYILIAFAAAHILMAAIFYFKFYITSKGGKKRRY